MAQFHKDNSLLCSQLKSLHQHFCAANEFHISIPRNCRRSDNGGSWLHGTTSLKSLPKATFIHTAQRQGQSWTNQTFQVKLINLGQSFLNVYLIKMLIPIQQILDGNKNSVVVHQSSHPELKIFQLEKQKIVL